MKLTETRRFAVLDSPFPFEPFRIKMVEPIGLTTPTERERLLREAGYNPFLIPADKISIDLLTDSGTGAMSQAQWSAMMMGDESYAGARSYYHLRDSVQKVTGMPYFTPTHQGRAAENVFFAALGVGSGQFVPANQHFDTTRANVEVRGARAVDLVVAEGLDPHDKSPFKGNIDVARLEQFIEEVGAAHIPAVIITITNNSGGGQPVSLANIRQAKALLSRYGIPLVLDAARFAENSYFIKMREPEAAGMSVAEIARATFDLADAFLMSAKKDAIVNIGGLIGLRDETLFQKVSTELILREGFITYGGLAGRDLEALAVGLLEGLDEDYLTYRIGQTAYLAGRLQNAGLPIMEPPGGHAVFIDAKEMLPHIPQRQFPAQSFVAEVYRAGGIRVVEIGSVMFGSIDPVTGEEHFPALELVRLAIPRRVYTRSHMDYVADVCAEVYRRRKALRGLEIVYQAPALRHFTARFKPVNS